MIVDKVFTALEEGDIEEDNSQTNDYLEDDDDEMSTDDGPNDLMTLFQYQTNVRRDALIQKGSHISDSSPKKERVEFGGSSS